MIAQKSNKKKIELRIHLIIVFIALKIFFDEGSKENSILTKVKIEVIN